MCLDAVNESEDKTSCNAVVKSVREWRVVTSFDGVWCVVFGVTG